MVKITDFDSVLEVAFGLNALFYIFELIPHTEDHIKELEKRHRKLYKRKVELTKNTYAFPIGFLVASTYPFYKQLLVAFSIMMSLVVMGFMLYSSFRPDAQMTVRGMWMLLIFAYGTPLIAFAKHRRTVGWVEAANRALEKEIEEAEQAEDRYAINIGEHHTSIWAPRVIARAKDISPILSRLTTDANVPYIKISKSDKNTFIKVTGRRKTGFIVEYQEGDSYHHLRAKRPCTKDETTEILVFYLNDSTEWKDMADWERVDALDQ